MKKTIKVLMIMLTFITSIFCVTSCFDNGGLSGKTYEVVAAEMRSNDPAYQDKLDMYSALLSNDIGKTLIFNADGTFDEESTLKSINGIQPLKKWQKSGNEIIINEGSNLYPTEASISGDQIIIKVGNINGLQYVYTLEEVK